MRLEPQHLNAAVRSRLAFFSRRMFGVLAPGEQLLWNWHLDAICHQLERVLSGEVKRLIIEVQPRSLKSLLGSVIFPAYVLGQDPTRKIIAASHSQELANKHSSDFRALLRSQAYQNLYPGTIIGGKDTERHITTRRGSRFATSPSGTLTGLGGDLIILDDIMSASQALSATSRETVAEWFRNSLYSRINDKRTGAIIVITQRLHIDDLPGLLREQGGWEILSLPSISPHDMRVALGYGRDHMFAAGDLLHPAREPQSVLDDLKATLGSSAFSAQYLQQPVPSDGEVVSWDWFPRYDTVPLRSGEDRVVQSWDIGMTDNLHSDYSVCTTWLVAGANYYLIDVARGRWLFPTLLRKVVELQRQFRPSSVLIEDMMTGNALIAQLRDQAVAGLSLPIARRPVGSKLQRFAAETPVLEAGHVHLPRNAAWLGDLRSELAQFPNGRHDDQVDSISQFLEWQRTRNKVGVRLIKIRGR